MCSSVYTWLLVYINAYLHYVHASNVQLYLNTARSSAVAETARVTTTSVMVVDRLTLTVKVKVKVKWICIAPSCETSKALRHGSHSVTCNYTDTCLYIVSVHQMAPPKTDVANI